MATQEATQAAENCNDNEKNPVEVIGISNTQEAFTWCPPGQRVVFRLVPAEAELFQMVETGRYIVRGTFHSRKTKDIQYISHTLLWYVQRVLRLAKKASVSIQYHLVDSGDGAAHLEILGLAGIEHDGGRADLTPIHNGIHYICSRISPQEPATCEDLSENGQCLDDASRLIADEAICKILDQVSDETDKTPFKVHAGSKVIDCGKSYAAKGQSAPVPLRSSVKYFGCIINMRTKEQSIDVQPKDSKSLISISYNPDQYLKRLREWLGETVMSHFVCAEQSNEEGQHPLLSLKDFQGGAGVDPDLFGYDRSST